MTAVYLDPAITVGGAAESGADDPMPDVEMRMVREALGLTGEDLARYLGVADRTVRRWEGGSAPIPDGVREAMEALEADAVAQAEALTARLADAATVTLTIPRKGGVGPCTAGWWRAVAYRVAERVPGLTVRYGD